MLFYTIAIDHTIPRDKRETALAQVQQMEAVSDLTPRSAVENPIFYDFNLNSYGFEAKLALHAIASIPGISCVDTTGGMSARVFLRIKPW